MKISRKLSPAGRQAERALMEAVADAIEEHRQKKLPLAVSENGRVVLITPREALRRLTGGTRSRGK